MTRPSDRITWRLGRDRRGATLIEFAIIAPVLCLLLIGAFDIGHTLYMRSVLQGVMQKAARDSGLETGTANTSVLDERVRAQIKVLANNADVKFSRTFYRTFSDAATAKAEPYTDTNGNKKCDANEPYEDQNRNNSFDASNAGAGQGGAKDAVLYTAIVSYPRMFPLKAMLGLSDTTVVKAAMILANQPYGDQAIPPVLHCA